ncbi:MAG: pyridoxal phosphate-dependent aminotransferase [Flavobacteriaceae bacterium]|nr:pyridoxal phosphate-dependent aminotransferase [Flavobacteriaceae bacterium]
MPKFSHKTEQLEFSPIRKLVDDAIDAKNRGLEVFHLNIGQPDISAPDESLKKITNNTLTYLPYGQSEGTEEYRRTLCDYYQDHHIHLSPKDIIVTTGSSEALIFCFNVICNPKDQVIIPEPFYANYNGFARSCDVDVIPIVSEFDSDFKLLPVQAFEEKVTDKTRAIVLCNPSNPTGYICHRQEIIDLCELAVKHNFFLIVDEVYREFIYDGSSHYSVLSSIKYAQHTIMIDSVSKRYSLCGARVGSIASRNHEFLQQVLKFAQLRLSPPTLDMIISQAAIQSSKKYLMNAVEEYRIRKEVAVEFLSRIPNVRVVAPRGAFFCMAELPIKDAEDFSKFLLTSFSDNHQTVMLAPGNGFYSDDCYGKNQIRIAFVLEKNKLKRAIQIIEKGLESYIARLND